MNIREGLTFDDVLLVPQYSSIDSRSKVDISTEVGTLHLRLPIIAANMDTVCEFEMAKAMWVNGGLGIFHRYATWTKIIKWMSEQHSTPRFPSIGVKPEDLETAALYKDLTTNICLDIAHGDSKHAADMVKALVKLGFKNIVAGNIATSSAAKRLIDAGANILKVGVGPGANCVTRCVTGHGVPQLTAIMDVARAVWNTGGTASIIADGGIRNSGDIVKALAAGADAVMIGSLLAGTTESPAAHMGVYRGMASAEAQIAHHGKVNNTTPEGVMTPVKLKGSVKDVLESLAGGIRSGCSYSGARNLKELREYAEWIKMSQAGLIESGPHGASK